MFQNKSFSEALMAIANARQVNASVVTPYLVNISTGFMPGVFIALPKIAEEYGLQPIANTSCMYAIDGLELESDTNEKLNLTQFASYYPRENADSCMVLINSARFHNVDVSESLFDFYKTHLTLSDAIVNHAAWSFWGSPPEVSYTTVAFTKLLVEFEEGQEKSEFYRCAFNQSAIHFAYPAHYNAAQVASVVSNITFNACTIDDWDYANSMSASLPSLVSTDLKNLRQTVNLTIIGTSRHCQFAGKLSHFNFMGAVEFSSLSPSEPISQASFNGINKGVSFRSPQYIDSVFHGKLNNPDFDRNTFERCRFAVDVNETGYFTNAQFNQTDFGGSYFNVSANWTGTHFVNSNLVNTTFEIENSVTRGCQLLAVFSSLGISVDQATEQLFQDTYDCYPDSLAPDEGSDNEMILLALLTGATIVFIAALAVLIARKTWQRYHHL